MRNCDAFTYIPQYGRGTASLNVAVATSIVLQHFATWAGYAEREREGFKFVVADRPPPERRTGVVKRIVPAQSDDAGEEMAAVDFSGDGCDLMAGESV
ncbi:hypothetical protein H632_c2682p0 [Helicosporidium sp. ATCC 50920]|nr:hypothetical protein H632_c2682p0 [Helicosporidium sp. ATCC 50920]|eukprot:KDD72967.1 hypothetical protein H632_c2682p0 [Helicosporidium sp. ATCC 50920]